MSRLIIISIVLLAVFASGWGLRNLQASRDTARRDASASNKELAAFVAEANRLSSVAERIQSGIDVAASQTQTHIVEYRTHEKLVPLPADCRIDAGRLQQLKAATVAVNAAPAPSGADGQTVAADSTSK
jgi:hypothetical protein